VPSLFEWTYVVNSWSDAADDIEDELKFSSDLLLPQAGSRGGYNLSRRTSRHQ